MSTGYTSCAIKCPYFEWDDKLAIHCEGKTRITFPNGKEKREYINTYCNRLDCWRCCTVAKARNKHYEEEEDGTQH